MFDDFGISLTKNAARQGFQDVNVINDQRRLMNRADEILARVGVHAGLSADRAVDHREQRGGDLHMRNASQINRRDESGEIADNSAAETDDERLSIQTGNQHLLADLADTIERL